MQGVLDTSTIEREMRDVMKNLDIEYIAFVNRDFKKIETIELKNSTILVACIVGETRLIDNIWL